MRKEEILKKSQLENRDEGEENAENLGRIYGITVMAVLFVCITMFTMIFSLENLTAFYAASAMFWGFLAVYHIPKYRFSGKRNSLIASVGYAVATVASLVSFVFSVMK